MVTRAQWMGLFTVLAMAPSAWARSNGIAGSSTAGVNCSGCHNAGAATPTVTLMGPSEIAPGSTHTYTLRIAGGPASVGGMNASAQGAPVTFGAGQDTKLMDGEVVHSQATLFVQGAASYTFQVTAPASPGSFTLQAAGLSGNGNSGTSGDGTGTTTLAVSVAVGGLDTPGSTTPGAPSTPANPDDPTAPADPANPSNPADPADPGAPVNPEGTPGGPGAVVGNGFVPQAASAGAHGGGLVEGEVGCNASAGASGWGVFALVVGAWALARRRRCAPVTTR